jgi:hypothetical protein
VRRLGAPPSRRAGDGKGTRCAPSSIQERAPRRGWTMPYRDEPTAWMTRRRRRTAFNTVAIALCWANATGIAGCQDGGSTDPEPDSPAAMPEGQRRTGTNDAGEGPEAEAEATRPDDAGTKNDDLFPLVDGDRRTYRVTRGTWPDCEGPVTVTFRGPLVEADGTTFYRSTMRCGASSKDYAVSDFARDAAGLLVRAAGSEWYRFLTLPPKEGASWAAGGSSGVRYAWSSEPTVSVPGGTFTDCWKRTSYPNGARFDVYCPGQGLVRSVLSDRSVDAEMSLELAAARTAPSSPRARTRTSLFDGLETHSQNSAQVCRNRRLHALTRQQRAAVERERNDSHEEVRAGTRFRRPPHGGVRRSGRRARG